MDKKTILETKTDLRSVLDISDLQHLKHIKRVENIIRRADGDESKEEKLATNMANMIRDIDKAYGRYLVSDELCYPHLAKIFLTRFKDLTYTIQDWRKEKIDNFLKRLKEERNQTNE